MSKQNVYIAQMLPGCEPYGSNPSIATSKIQPSYMGIPGTEYSPPTNYGDYAICVATKVNGDACQQATVMHTNLCMGHLKSLANKMTPLKEGEVYDADTIVKRAFPELNGE